MEIKKNLEQNPIVKDIAECKEVFWLNEKAVNIDTMQIVDMQSSDMSIEDISIEEADARLQRFAPFIKKIFPDAEGGIIESELREIPAMKAQLSSHDYDNINKINVKGRLFLKCDSHLPVSGSIKARGGIYEVLKVAERIAVEEGGLTLDEDYSVLAEPRFKELFSKYKVAVGSTGNLGLSIGIISAALGFEVTVHMSSDAREWKKDMLRSKGVKVIEYPDDYEAAVAQGRKEASEDPKCHFIDDENSKDLFEGYSLAGKRLKKQLDDMGIIIDDEHKLYVYLPCGVGGAPGGVCWGIKQYFGENAICIFAEPTHAPCMVLGLATGLKNKIAVGDVGIDGKTEADGLAVGRPSALVSNIMEKILAGAFTVDDDKLYSYLRMLKDSEEIFIEPSACAAFEGLRHICHNFDGLVKEDAKRYLEDENSVHIVWATGGNMVPEAEKEAYYMKGIENSGQKRLEAHVQKTLEENNIGQKDSVNGMMKSKIVGCSYEEGTITFGFPLQSWQVNRAGMLHGGIICVAFDMTIAALARFYAKENFAPTVSLDVKYLRPVDIGDELLVTAKAVATGKRLTQLICEARSKKTGKLVATGASVYLNVDTSKK